VATTEGTTDGSQRYIQIIVQRRGAGIILAILSILFLMGTGAARRAQAQTYIVLHNFTHGNDGANPHADLVRDPSAGTLYGTTELGGSSGLGTVFKLDPSGTLTVLHNFAGGANDGGVPVGRLVMDSHGNLYGTTHDGGSATRGAVFKLDTSGTLNVLHSLSYCTAANPYAGLVMDSHGNLYGTTYHGGNGVCLGSAGEGAAFKLDPSGTLTVLHSFAGGTNDGAFPVAGLVMDSHGNLYGTTEYGGSANCSGGCGTVFKLDTSGTLTLLHSFTGGTNDGANPDAGLVMDSSGNLYGTTYNGGGSGNGVVFALSTTPQGAIQIIVNQVNGLLAQGVIDGQQGGSLVKELNLAIAMINAGQISNAITDLESFISNVTALENSGVLSSDQATALINAAESVITQIQ
jgi:uncharacterized repeat protein (TIGR03803 family)